jgi:hypothetical protein
VLDPSIATLLSAAETDIGRLAARTTSSAISAKNFVVIFFI